ncbi:DUF5805 domain-containing protein [Halopelagius longus]|uniref:Uncharacterized protein n=1 Tax=Halopelagius longus TaxID=1236180 RepID=A0A1H1AG63_9EURY|nr:DUF5805 domain-containing protein [Halopelagius longus]RDI70367.1 hypothetical protein DWB78_00770 [Halopelagius longus]SDQ38682.1 hypothetical protein SAMN05216278_1322 [Halopelagius longus]
MSSDGADGERKTVQTYVPAYQKEAWAEHADRLGMSQSEFVRTMVQAGRRDFEVPERSYGEAESEGDSSDEGGTDGFEESVLDALSVAEYRSWDELLDTLTEDIEDRLDETLQELQAENLVQYSGRHGGYTVAPGAVEEANDGR